MASDSAIELIVVTYSDPEKAPQTLTELRKKRKHKSIHLITGSALVKTATGSTDIIDALKIDKKRGTRFGALAGGLLAIVAPPVGIAALLFGSAAGAAVGHSLSGRGDKKLTEIFIKRIMEGVAPNSSVLILIAEEGHSAEVEKALAEYGGDVHSHTLTAEDIEALSADGPQSDESDEDRALAAANEVKALIATNPNPDALRFEKVFVVINPASGQDKPILNVINTVFHTAGIDYDIGITKHAGDAAKLAKQASEAGYDIVAAYGGDGTVMEAATGLMGTDTPLAIFPGGTNNVMSVELGVPKELLQAAALIAGAPAEIKAVDMGRANDQLFILRVGIGYEALINQGATREMKDRYGGLAYSIAGLQALRNPPTAKYTLDLDGEIVEMEGIWCMVANSASLGSQRLNLAQGVDVGDGLLDVIMVGEAALHTLTSVAASVTNTQRVGQQLPQWKVRKVVITADPPQAVTGDGEIWDPTPLTCEVVPAAVKILVPTPSQA